MEVHHHPDLHHNKKKWKEYFLEFLMIFLAVTLGFFAETLRESITEKHREKNYIEGLIKNVQSDTLNLNDIIQASDFELKGIDTLLKTSKKNFINTSVQDSIFYYAISNTFNLLSFQFNDLTIVQLRNAGGYSLIKKDDVADSIAAYESRNNFIKLQERFYTDANIETWSSFKKVFDLTLANAFIRKYRTNHKIPDDIDVLISKDQDKINTLFNDYWSLAVTLTGYNNMLRQHLIYLRSFVNLLQEKYNMK